jgi:hypothetical protein
MERFVETELDSIEETFVDSIFRPFNHAKQKLGYLKLKKQLSDIINSAKGLAEFEVPAGDARYKELWSQADLLLTNFTTNNSLYTRGALEAAMPALEMVEAMTYQAQPEVSKLDQAKEQAHKIISGLVMIGAIGTGAAIFIVPPVIAFIHHYYAWWMRLL